MGRLRDITLHAVRTLGGFRIAQRLTRDRLRVLCYHGFSVGDEYQTQPYMFVRAETFERRLQVLEKRRVRVIALDEAVRRLQAREIRNAETVITIDDGWTSTLTIGAPILKRFGFPATVYVTTEHLGGDTEVFNVALCYMILRSPLETVHLTGLHPKIDGHYDLRQDPIRTLLTLIGAAETAFPVLADRQRQLPAISEALHVDLAAVLRGERFRLLTEEQMRELAGLGFDIELHTHSHRLPDQDFESAASQIEYNRAALESVLGTRPNHFCFPSGEYSPQHPEWLARLGIVSATTCDPGLNPPGSSALLLKRFLDSDEVTDIAFEAEVSGFRELVRNGLAALRARRFAGGTASRS